METRTYIIIILAFIAGFAIGYYVGLYTAIDLAIHVAQKWGIMDIDTKMVIEVIAKYRNYVP